MTMVGLIRSLGTPIYLGDMLLSSPISPSGKVSIPASEDINALIPAGAGRFIAGIKQKLVIVNDRLIVGWAGSALEARSAIREIAEFAAKQHPTRDDIFRLVSTIPERDRRDLSLLGTTAIEQKDGGLLLENFEVNVDHGWRSNNGNAAIGSGAMTFLKTLEKFLKSNAVQNAADPYLAAAGTGLGLSAAFIGHEMTSGSNLLDWWGGGVEIALLDKQKFTKLGDALHTFWAVDVSFKPNRLWLIPKFVKYDYIGDLLTIQKLDCTVTEKQTLKRKSHTLHVYTPLLRGISDYNISSLDFPALKPRHVCCYLVGPDEHVGVVAKLNDAPFYLVPSHKQLQISIRRDFVVELEANVSSVFGPTTFAGLRG